MKRMVWEPVRDFDLVFCNCGCGATVENHPLGIQAMDNTGHSIGVKADAVNLRLCHLVETDAGCVPVTPEVIAALETLISYHGHYDAFRDETTILSAFLAKAKAQENDHA